MHMRSHGKFGFGRILALAALAGLAVAVILAWQPAPAVRAADNTPTVPAGTPAATPQPTAPAAGATEAVPLVVGCNPVVATWPNGTPATTVAAAVSPPSALGSIWKFTAAGGIWAGFSPTAPLEVNDLQSVQRLDAVFVCMNEAGTLNRPKI